MERRTEDRIDELFDYETDGVGIGGTRRVGTLKASKKELRRHFGEPSTSYPKSSAHWQVRFADGTVTTIYDYRESNRHAEDTETVEWSIGGQGEGSVELLKILGLEVQ